MGALRDRRARAAPSRPALALVRRKPRRPLGGFGESAASVICDVGLRIGMSFSVGMPRLLQEACPWAFRDGFRAFHHHQLSNSQGVEQVASTFVNLSGQYRDKSFKAPMSSEKLAFISALLTCPIQCEHADWREIWVNRSRKTAIAQRAEQRAWEGKKADGFIAARLISFCHFPAAGLKCRNAYSRTLTRPYRLQSRKPLSPVPEMRRSPAPHGDKSAHPAHCACRPDKHAPSRRYAR